MSRFYVGQRVRIKWSNGWPELAGKHGVIVSRCPDRGIHGDSEWRVAPDCWGTFEAPTLGTHGGSCFAPNSSQLEPATDSYDLSTWDKCVWQPEHLRANA